MVNRPRQGMVMMVAMVAILVLATLGAGYLATASAQAQRSAYAEESVRLLAVAEAGIGAAMQEVLGGDSGVLNDVAFGDGTTTFSTTVAVSGDDYTFTSTASNGRWSRTVQVVAELTTSTATATARAAIEADTDVSTGGSFVVDGRDYDYTSGSIVGNGVYGISTTGTVDRQGNSKIGGNGVAPAKSEAQTEQNAFWGDYNDNDGDSQTDEEAWDGIDNDGDGQTDEDTSDYPSGPDVRLGLPEGTLKSAAQAAGTYFTSGADFETWLANAGGTIPGGSIIFIEADNWISANLGDALPSSPCLLVCHNSDSDMLTKDIHGNFLGALLLDSVDHTNGNALIYGAILCQSGQLGNAFGNGAAIVRYSSNALANLPSVGGGTFHGKSWVETTAP